MIAADGTPRAPYRLLHESIQRSGTQELRAGVDALARAYLNQGVTFDVGGEERPFPLDIVPRVIDDAEWQTIETGVRQRVQRARGVPRRRLRRRPGRRATASSRAA